MYRLDYISGTTDGTSFALVAAAKPTPKPRRLSTGFCLQMERLGLPIPPPGMVLPMVAVDAALAGKRIEERMRIKMQMAAFGVIKK